MTFIPPMLCSRLVSPSVLTETIRARVAAGIVLIKYAFHAMLAGGGNSIARHCHGCDVQIATTKGEIAVGYRSHSGELHWFHLACNEIRKAVSNTGSP